MDLEGLTPTSYINPQADLKIFEEAKARGHTM